MGTARLTTLASLIDWTNQFKGDHSRLFLDQHAPSLTAVIDYHQSGAPDDQTLDKAIKGEGLARHCGHRAEYTFPISKAWKRWIGAAGNTMEVVQFGAFIEDNAADLLDPTPYIHNGEGDAQQWEIEARKVAQRLKGEFAPVDQMIDLGRTFYVSVDQKMSVKVDRQSQIANLVIQEEHGDEGGNPLKLPRLFLIAIPVFEMGELFPIVCTFGYSARGGVRLNFNLYDAQAALELAITEVADKATKDCDLPLFYGCPES